MTIYWYRNKKLDFDQITHKSAKKRDSLWCQRDWVESNSVCNHATEWLTKSDDREAGGSPIH